MVHCLAYYAVWYPWDSSFFMGTKMVCLRLGRCHWIPSIIALSDPRNLCQHPHVHGHWKSQDVEKTLFYMSPCFWYHFKMVRDREMRFSPKQRKLKIDIVSSKFEQNWWRGSQEIAKNVRPFVVKTLVMFLNQGNLYKWPQLTSLEFLTTPFDSSCLTGPYGHFIK